HADQEQQVTVFEIRPAGPRDWPAIWQVLSPVFATGETYAYPMDISECEARTVWLENPLATFIGCDDAGHVVATYYLLDNQVGQGAHVANCGYVVAESARGRGWAGALCRHSQQQALHHGFRAMQFNFVASTNEGAIRLWQHQGFEIVGRLPGAFCHPR